MRFSIIIPVYQTKAYLEACVRSVLEQNFFDFELILIDDGSTDGSWKLCQDLALHDSRIQCYQQPHQGVSIARNLGLNHATGDYLTFFDSDDTITPGTLEKIDALITKHDVDLIIFSINHLTQTSRQSTSEQWLLSEEIYRSASDFITALIHGRRLLLYSCANKFYRRDIVQKHGMRFPSETDFGEDRLFNFQYLRHARVIRTSSHLSYNYYTRKKPSLSQSYRTMHSRELLSLHESKRELVETLALPSVKRNQFIATDFYYEIRAAFQHLIRHWSQLTPDQRRQEIRTLTSLNYPGYFWVLKQRSLKIRLGVNLIEHRLNFILRLLVGTCARFNAKTRVASENRAP